MQPFPHHYAVRAHAQRDGSVAVDAYGLPTIDTAPPREFDGPGDRWSPEELLLAAVADCFALTFRALARRARFAWSGLDVRVDGVVERADRVIRFSEVSIHADLALETSDPDERESAQRTLVEAESACLITNSLNASVKFETSLRG